MRLSSSIFYIAILHLSIDFADILSPDLAASAQPLPLSIIWGGLKIIIEVRNIVGIELNFHLYSQIAGRRKEAFDLMSKELRALLDQLFVINDYEGLYGDSDEMQTLIFRSYKNIIRFWHRVYKECSTTSMFTLQSYVQRG